MHYYRTTRFPHYMKGVRPLTKLTKLPIAALLLSCVFLNVAMQGQAKSGARVQSWTIDPAHSGVEFKVGHLAVSSVHGSLSKVTGTVELDETDITQSKVVAVIDARTVSTNEGGRDNHLKGPEFFNVAKYPTITFKSTSISNTAGKLQMIGDLTLAGVTKSVTLLVDGPAPEQKGKEGMVSGFSATGTLHRPDFNFGMKYGPPLIGSDVKFTIDIEMDHK